MQDRLLPQGAEQSVVTTHVRPAAATGPEIWPEGKRKIGSRRWQGHEHGPSLCTVTVLAGTICVHVI
jgi:hypothetical protein